MPFVFQRDLVRCSISMLSVGGRFTAISWTGVLAFDSVVFSLTLYKALTIGRGIWLLDVIVRDDKCLNGAESSRLRMDSLLARVDRSVSRNCGIELDLIDTYPGLLLRESLSLFIERWWVDLRLAPAFHLLHVLSAAGVALTQLSEREVLAVEESISPFIASVIPVHQMGAVHVTDKHNLIVTVVHTLTQAALIRLYYLRGEVDQLRSEKCLLAARGILLLIGQVSDMDIAFLDPIVGVESWSPIASNELGGHVGTITTALPLATT
ncbi:hypothetical protein BC827DRAFT_1158133 [Russula dissimulans]|nr:hypothetical protein BC827DRAFT_1158133 [Russula dissimulans]